MVRSWFLTQGSGGRSSVGLDSPCSSLVPPAVEALLIRHHPKPFQKQPFAPDISTCVLCVKSLRRLVPVLRNQELGPCWCREDRAQPCSLLLMLLISPRLGCEERRAPRHTPTRAPAAAGSGAVKCSALVRVKNNNKKKVNTFCFAFFPSPGRKRSHRPWHRGRRYVARVRVRAAGCCPNKWHRRRPARTH